MTQIIKSQIVYVSVLSAAQARSKDGKGRISIQGFLSKSVEGKGKKAKTVIHEFSCLREIRKITEAGKYVFDGTLVLLVEDAPSKTHDVNGVTYARHNAKIIGGAVKGFEKLPNDVEFGAMPF